MSAPQLLLLLFLSVPIHLQCNQDSAPPADTGVDAQPAVDAHNSADTSADTAVHDVDIGSPTPDSDRCQLLDVELSDGSLLRGQFIYAFDHRFWWWDAADKTTIAFFRADRFAPFPDDRSFSFVDADQLVSVTNVGPADDNQCYFEWLEGTDFTLPQLPLEGQSQVLMGHEGYHRYESGYGDFAWDFTRTVDTGTRFEDDGTANEHYFIWDEPVYSPAQGQIVEVIRGQEDNPPGSHPDEADANLIGIHLGGGFHLYLLHFRQDSIPEELSEGTTVERGDFLGTVGNSGVSLEPHLHMTILWWNPAQQRYWSIPTVFDRVAVADFPGAPLQTRTNYIPATGQTLSEP